MHNFIPMATLVQIRSEIIEDIKKYDVTDLLAIDPTLVDDKIVEANLSVLKKFSTEKLPLAGFYYPIPVSITCKRDTFTIGGFAFTDKTPYFTCECIPLVKFLGDQAIAYFGYLGYSGEISLLSLQDFVNRKYARYSYEMPCGTRIGDTIILKNLPEALSTGTLVAIPEDPRQTPGWDDDTSNFPTASVEAIKIMVKNSIVGTPLLPDLAGGTLTNAKEQPIQQGKPQKEQDE